MGALVFAARESIRAILVPPKNPQVCDWLLCCQCILQPSEQCILHFGGTSASLATSKCPTFARSRCQLQHRVFWRALGLSLEAAERKWGCPSYWNTATESDAVSLMATQDNTFFERRGVVRTAIGVSSDQSDSSACRKLQHDVVV